MADVQSAIDRVQFPLEYHAEILPGRATESHAAALRLLAIIGGAALAIFVLLQAAFGSWRLALTAVVTLSAAVSGSVLVTAATGGPITLGALVGFLPVLAVASRSLLGLIWRIRDLERDGSGPFGLDLVVRASSERLATTLTSVAAIALSVAPFLFLGDRAGYEIVRPMALVIGGGLCTSTLVTLFLVPAISLRFASIAEPEDTVQPRLVGSTNAGPA
jgi:Cu/Ag efflux pump CusA